MAYNVDGLKNGIVQAKKNIETFKDAIRKENDIIESYKNMIFHLEQKENILGIKEQLEKVSNGN